VEDRWREAFTTTLLGVVGIILATLAVRFLTGTSLEEVPHLGS